MARFISPAKINLFLQILHRRNDGYHELASFLQTISLHDILHISFNEHDQLTCQDEQVPTDRSNLILKAVELFRNKTGLSFCVSIHLEKHIPMQAGLGGGSSNAATTLFALNELLKKPLTLEELKCLGSKIGSDVPFFFSEGSSYCTGRGEIVKNLCPPPNTPLFIVKPDLGLSTPLIFQNMQPSDFSKKDSKKVLDHFLAGKPNYFNDLETAAFRLEPTLKKLKNHLKNQNFDAVLMSGSGSAFFCLSENPPSPYPSTTVFKAQFLNRTKENWYKA